MKYLIIILCSITFSCSNKKNKPTLPTSDYILQKSIQSHDPNSKWSGITIDLHVQEPRNGNPSRFSQVKLNNTTGAFELIRNRDEHFSTHQISADGIATTLFDDQVVNDTTLIDKYRLDPNRNKIYRSYYQNLYGLPMVLPSMVKNTTVPVEEVAFNGHTCYKLTFALNEKMFSNDWNVYFTKSDYKVAGIEIFFPEDRSKGERIYFDGRVSFGTVSIARHRHWHTLNNDTYSGSDIILESRSIH